MFIAIEQWDGHDSARLSRGSRVATRRHARIMMMICRRAFVVAAFRLARPRCGCAVLEFHACRSPTGALELFLSATGAQAHMPPLPDDDDDDDAADDDVVVV